MGTTDQFPQTDRNAGKRDVILFVDDEPPIRELMKTCLETEGFDVITAANGLEGLQRYKENENKVRVVVTDLQMPAMNGSDMIQQIFELTPAMKVIVASGQSFKYAQAAAACGATSCLQKPYSPSELRDALRSLL